MVPQVFLRKEGERAFGGVVSQYIHLSLMRSKAKEATYNNLLKQ